MKLTASATIALIAASLFCTACQATNQQLMSWECHSTEQSSVAVCMNRSSKIPCTMVSENNRFHVEAMRARLVRGYAYLEGSFSEIGPYGDNLEYLIHTNDGVKWELGACFPQNEGAIWQ